MTTRSHDTTTRSHDTTTKSHDTGASDQYVDDYILMQPSPRPLSENIVGSDHNYANTGKYNNMRPSIYDEAEETATDYINVGLNHQPQYANADTNDSDSQYENVTTSSSTSSKPGHTYDVLPVRRLYDSHDGYSAEYSVAQELRQKFTKDQISCLMQTLQELQVRSGSTASKIENLSYLVSVTTKVLSKL